MRHVLAVLGLVISFSITQTANAITFLPGPGGTTLTVEDNAFADVLLSSVGTYNVFPGASTLSTVLTDTSLSTSARLDPSTPDGTPSFLELGFTDNVLVNLAGADLAIYDLGGNDDIEIQLSIGGAQVNATTMFTGVVLGTRNLNVALFDLSPLGLGFGDILDNIFIETNDAGNNPRISLIVALNSAVVPEPATLALLGSGLFGLGFARRKKLV